MNVEIVSKTENKLMDRVEVDFKAAHDGEPTPTRDATRQALANALSVPKERVIVSNMDSVYGKGISKGAARVYTSTESAKSHEREHIQIRNGLAVKQVPGAAAPAPAKKKKTR